MQETCHYLEVPFTRIRFDVITTSTHDVELFDLRNVHDNLILSNTPANPFSPIVLVSNFVMNKIIVICITEQACSNLTTAPTHKG